MVIPGQKSQCLVLAQGPRRGCMAGICQVQPSNRCRQPHSWKLWRSPATIIQDQSARIVAILESDVQRAAHRSYVLWIRSQSRCEWEGAGKYITGAVLVCQPLLDLGSQHDRLIMTASTGGACAKTVCSHRHGPPVVQFCSLLLSVADALSRGMPKGDDSDTVVIV